MSGVHIISTETKASAFHGTTMFDKNCGEGIDVKGKVSTFDSWGLSSADCNCQIWAAAMYRHNFQRITIMKLL